MIKINQQNWNKHVAVIFSFCLFATSTSAQTFEQSISFTRLETRYCVGNMQRTTRVIRNQSELKKLTGKQQGSKSAFPKIDFRKQMLIVVTQGRQPSSGYKIQINRLVETADALRVMIEEIIPGKPCNVQDVETTPCDVVVAKRINKRIEFVTQRRSTDCE